MQASASGGEFDYRDTKRCEQVRAGASECKLRRE